MLAGSNTTVWLLLCLLVVLTSLSEATAASTVSSATNVEVVSSSTTTAYDVSCVAELVKSYLITDPCEDVSAYATQDDHGTRVENLYNVTNNALATCGKSLRIRVGVRN